MNYFTKHFRWTACAAGFALLLGVSGCNKGGGGAKVDVSAQVQILKGSDKDAKVDACVKLGEAGESAGDAVPALIELLADKGDDGLVRRMAAYALGQIGPKAKAAVPVLKTLLGDPVREVVTQTLVSLRAIDPSSVPKMDDGSAK